MIVERVQLVSTAVLKLLYQLFAQEDFTAQLTQSHQPRAQSVLSVQVKVSLNYLIVQTASVEDIALCLDQPTFQVFAIRLSTAWRSQQHPYH